MDKRHTQLQYTRTFRVRQSYPAVLLILWSGLVFAQTPHGSLNNETTIQPYTGAVMRSAEAKVQDFASVTDFLADPSGATNTSAQLALAFGVPGIGMLVPPGTYNCGNSALLSSPIVVNSTMVYAEGATFTGGCIFTTLGSTNGLSWVGGTMNTSAITGTGGSPVFLVATSHVSFVDTRWIYAKNYTAIQICWTSPCPDDVNIDGIETNTGAESHITVTGGSNVRIANWYLNGGDETGLALEPLTAAINNVSATNVVANGVADILQLAGATYTLSNVSLNGWSCTNCAYAFETQDSGTGTAARSNVSVSNGQMVDLSGTLMVNLVNMVTSLSIPHSNFSFSNDQGFGQFSSTGFNPGWIKIQLTGGAAVFDHFSFSNLQLTTSGSGGVSPIYTIVLANNGNSNWTNWIIDNVTTNGATGACISSTAGFVTQADLTVQNSHFAGCYSSSPTSDAHSINNLAIWRNNTTILNASQTELFSTLSSNPIGVPFLTLTGNTFAGLAIGTQQYCNDCSATTPASGSGSGATCTVITGPAWACGQQPSVTSGASDPFCGGLLVFAGAVPNAIFAVGPCASAPGLTIHGQVQVILNAGVTNTLSYNGGPSLPIVRSSNPSANLATSISVNGIITLTQTASSPTNIWQINSQ